MIQVGAFNITMEHTPLQFSGVSLGMSVVLVLIGSSIGPAIAAIYMQTHQQELANRVDSGGSSSSSSSSNSSFPSPISYDLIFLTAALISAISIALVIILKRNMTQSQSTLKKLEIEASSKKRNDRFSTNLTVNLSDNAMHASVLMIEERSKNF